MTFFLVFESFEDLLHFGDSDIIGEFVVKFLCRDFLGDCEIEDIVGGAEVLHLRNPEIKVTFIRQPGCDYTGQGAKSKGQKVC